ncbi:MAG TPA: universal stress protein [Thermodesulfovibrionales bacterium]|nr:universal stress protein [Thermodesulfovibrionales bacterium]
MENAPICPLARLEKLLVATDETEFSEGAIREAIDFAKRCSSKLYALFVLETNPEYETIGSSVYEMEEAEAQTRLESVKMRAAQEGLDCETIFHHATDPYRHIVDEAAEKGVDMIIMGRRGRKGLMKVLMGEVAAKVIAHAPCKVLIVPRAAKIACRTILVATDGSFHGNAAVAEAVAVAKRCGGSLIVVSAARSGNDLAEAQAHARTAVSTAEKEAVPAESLTPVGRPYDVILETAGGRGVDLIVMGAYGKTGLKKLLMGSSTEKVISHAGCAVLVAKA